MVCIKHHRLRPTVRVLVTPQSCQAAVCQLSTSLTILRIVKGLVHSDVAFGFTELNVKNKSSQVEKEKVHSRQLECRCNIRDTQDSVLGAYEVNSTEQPWGRGRGPREPYPRD